MDPDSYEVLVGTPWQVALQNWINSYYNKYYGSEYDVGDRDLTPEEVEEIKEILAILEAGAAGENIDLDYIQENYPDLYSYIVDQYKLETGLDPEWQDPDVSDVPGDVQVQIPDYSVIATTIVSGGTVEEVIGEEAASDYEEYVKRVEELKSEGIRGAELIDVLVEEGYITQEEADQINAEVDSILAEIEEQSQAASGMQDLVIYTGDSVLVKDGVWEPSGIKKVLNPDGTFSNVFIYTHKETGEVWEIPEEDLGTYGGVVVNPEAYEGTSIDPDEGFIAQDEFEQKIWDMGIEAGIDVEIILQDID